MSVVPAGPRLAIRLGLHDVEVLVQVHVDLLAVVERDLDLILALFVVDLGFADLALAGVGEGNADALVERSLR